MTKSKVPSLPPNAPRSAVIAFRDNVRTYARKEFERGSSPAEVYERVAPNGQLWALRSSIDAEYLDFLGVSRKNARASAVVAAMATYFIISGFEPPSVPFLRFGVPLVFAMLVARGVEVFVTGLLRNQAEKQKKQLH